MDCVFESLLKGSPCIACGVTLPKSYSEPPYRECGQAVEPKSEVGPGTKLKKLLDSKGITADWYISMKESVGLLPECDCQFRLDVLDAAWAGWKKGGWKAAKQAYQDVHDRYAKSKEENPHA